jgi:hypothetical protein
MSSGTDRQSLGQSLESLKNTSIFSTDHKTLSVFSANNDKESDQEEERSEKCISEDDIKIARYRRKLFRDSVLQEESSDSTATNTLPQALQDNQAEGKEASGAPTSEAVASHKQPNRTLHLKSKLEDDHTVDAETSTSTRP